MARIDWRRSARDDHTYVRDREWEAAHTVWLWADPSPSMLYKSTRRRPYRSESRALVLDPGAGRALVAQRRAHRLAGPDRSVHGTQRCRAASRASRSATQSTCRPGPISRRIRRFSDIVIAGDFLDPADEIDGLAGRARAPWRARPPDRGRRSGRGNLPYAGRTEFTDPETGEKLTAGRAETCCATTTASPILARREELDPPGASGSAGASRSTTPTASPSEALVRLHMALAADGGYAAGGRA